MATKKEIREWLIGWFVRYDIMSEKGNPPLISETLDSILTYLDSQGVVLKVERELPRDCENCKHHHCYYDSDGYQDCSCDITSLVNTQTLGIPENCPLKAGFTAVGPLV